MGRTRASYNVPWHELSSRLTGPLLEAGDEGYDAARALWNARFDRRPDAIARCADASDVAEAVRFAVSNGALVSVKGGGHQYAGNTVGDGGLLIDLGEMRDVTVDAGARLAVVGAGATMGAFDGAAQEHGLATTGGTVSSVGVAGLTLGGGQGWLSRTHGMTCDNLVAAEVVTATGDIVRASEEENEELLWALRGGGGNFGVATSFTYRLHQVGPEVVAGQVVYPAERGRELLRVYRDVFRDAPDELCCFPFFFRVPPVEAFPEALHGDLVLAFVLAWVGPVEAAERNLAPFRSQGDPLVEAVGPVSYLALQQSFDAGMGPGNRWYTRAHDFDELTDEALDTLVARLDPFPGELTAVYFGPGGGAVGRVAPDATAYPHRGTEHGLHIFPGWMSDEDDEEIMSWARGLSEAMAPHANGGVYVNLLGEDEPERVRAAYGSNYERLARIKRTWDPGNVFRGNHNIVPA
jgi:FAD/FMN-containing dehydrogenase